MDELDLKKLREVAERATQGNWEECGAAIDTDVDPYEVVALETVGSPYMLHEVLKMTEPDATHIATFDPPTVIALLDRLERAETDAKVGMDAALDRIGELLSVGGKPDAS